MGILKGAVALAFWPISVPVWITKEIVKASPPSSSTPKKCYTTTTTTYTATKSSSNPTKEQIKRERNKMTNAVRERIKARDNYTCQKCGNSIYKEPNLLLEVDHIVPVSRGGKTVDSNLQCLCWKCNRSKGATTQFFTGAIPCWKCARHDTAICSKCPNGEYFREER